MVHIRFSRFSFVWGYLKATSKYENLPRRKYVGAQTTFVIRFERSDPMSQTNTELGNSTTQEVWFLSGQIDESQSNREFPMHSFPFTIGRRAESSLPLPVGCISKDHAIIEQSPEGLVLQELGSTNGTS